MPIIRALIIIDVDATMFILLMFTLRIRLPLYAKMLITFFFAFSTSLVMISPPLRCHAVSAC